MSQPVLQVWTAPKCQPGASPFAPLPVTVSARITETVGGTDDAGQVVIPRDVALAHGVAEGRVLRAVFPLRGAVEWVVTRVVDGDPRDTTTVTLAPLRQLLALRGVVRSVTGATTSLTLPAFSGTVAELLTARVLTNLSDDSLTWLSAGTIDPTAVYPWPGQTAVRRGEVLTLIEQVTGADVVLRRLADDAGYAIDVLTQQGSTATPRLLSGAVQQLDRTRDLLQTATEVLPIGDDGAPMGEVDWTGGTPSGSGPYWIPLTDPAGGAAPIQQDDQCVGCVLALPGGTTLPILDSRASDSAVQVASLGAYSAGARVVIWEAASGRPVTRLSAPAAQAESRGQVTAKVTVKGARQERTLNRNGDFLDGATQWTPGVQGTAMRRSDFGTSWSALVNGSRASGTGTGTPLSLDNGPANTPIYRGLQLVIAGVTHTFSSDVVPNTSGAITASITPNLTATYADDFPVPVIRREVRQWVKDGTTSFATWASTNQLAMRDVASDGLLFRPITGLSVIHDASGFSFTGNVVSLTYTSGTAGTFVMQTSGGIGLPPANFTDGDTFTVIFTRETRTLRFNGTQSSGASSVSFKAVSALARRDWVNTDTIYARRSLSATAVITAFDNTTNTATINTGTSTLDDVASADRDGNAVLWISPNHIDLDYTISGGTGSPLPLNPWIVTGISGSSMTLTPDVAQIAAAFGVAPFQVTINRVTGQANWPQTYTAEWTVIDSYAVASGASWGNNGRATVSVTIPAGRTIARGTPLYSNWVGGGSTGAAAQSPTPLFAHAAVTGSASSLEVAGWDDYRSDWDGSTAEPTGVWRLFSGTAASSFGFAGETLVVATDTTFDGSGVARVTLTAANTTTISDNATVDVTIPAMIPSGKRTTGRAMRLLFSGGGIGALTPGAAAPAAVVSESAYVAVPSGTTRQATAVARIVCQSSSIPAIAPPCAAIVRTATGTIAGSAEAEFTELGNGLLLATVVVRATLTASGLYALHLYGGSNTLFKHWHVALDAQWYLGSDVLPFFNGARSRVAWQRGQQVLAARQASARYRLTAIDQAELLATGEVLVPGQSVVLVNPALNLHTTQRVVSLEWDWPSGAVVDIECAALTPKLTDVTISL